MSCDERADDFEARRQRLQALSDEELHVIELNKLLRDYAIA